MKVSYILIFILMFSGGQTKAENNYIDPVFMLGMDYPYIRDRMQMEVFQVMDKTFLAEVDIKEFSRMFPLLKTRGL